MENKYFYYWDLPHSYRHWLLKVNLQTATDQGCRKWSYFRLEISLRISKGSAKKIISVKTFNHFVIAIAVILC